MDKATKVRITIARHAKRHNWPVHEHELWPLARAIIDALAEHTRDEAKRRQKLIEEERETGLPLAK